MSTILKYFPYETPREVQAELLQTLESIWDDYDVFVVTLPTSAGKTAISKTIMDWARGDAVTILPTNMLIDQYLREFPDTATLARLDSYECSELEKTSCASVRGKRGRFCRGCPASADLQQAKYKKRSTVVNYYTYLSQKLYRKVLVVDEAHALIPTMRGFDTKILWKHDAEYAHNMYSLDQVKFWLSRLSDKKKKLKKIQQLVDIIYSEPPTHVVERGVEWFNGKGTLRGEPEQRDCLKYYPLEPSPGTKNLFFPKETEKIVLMSATISKVDIEELGLGKRRVVYLNAASPIPRGSRPIVPVNLGNVNRNNMDASIKQIAYFIEHVLLPRHEGEKGLIHVTYQMANLLRPLLEHHPRIMFHDKYNKTKQYELFRQAPASTGRALIACGMYEGVDLPNDLGRWQLVAKIPWPSLGNPAIAYKSQVNQEWYVWETLKAVIQACGRICRTPTDFGVTYITDTSFSRLLKQGEHIAPTWWTEAITATEEVTSDE